MKNKLLALVVLSFSIACKKEDDNNVIVVSASGDISARVNEFRQLLGDKLNTVPGATGGRREINWDGVPDDLLGKPLPLNFLNNTEPGAPASQQRGLVYEPGDSFVVSKTNFSEINPEASGEFSAFSGSRTFANTSSNLWGIGFELPGQDIEATVRGFGIVFSDVDLASNTSIEFFNESKSLGRFFAPVQSQGSKLSFLGVYFKDQRITRIKVQHGNGLLTTGQKDISAGGSADLVILDDFLYDEPVKK
jgi:hypothetical protein